MAYCAGWNRKLTYRHIKWATINEIWRRKARNEKYNHDIKINMLRNNIYVYIYNCINKNI